MRNAMRCNASMFFDGPSSIRNQYGSLKNYLCFVKQKLGTDAQTGKDKADEN